MTVFDWVMFAGMAAQAAGLVWAKWKVDDAEWEKEHAQWCLARCRETRDMLTDINLRNVAMVVELKAEAERLRHEIEGRGVA